MPGNNTMRSRGGKCQSMRSSDHGVKCYCNGLGPVHVPGNNAMCSRGGTQSNLFNFKHWKCLQEDKFMICILDTSIDNASCLFHIHTFQIDNCERLNNGITLKGLPGCFFTRTFLPKSSNNLEPICNHVNVKCSRLVILRIISVTI